MLDHNLVLKSDELYLTGEISTDGSGEQATGLYARDTRHLCRFAVTLNGLPLDLLSARVLGAASGAVSLANRPLSLADGSRVMPHTVAVEERLDLDECFHGRITLTNFTGRPLPLTLAVDVAADFRDLFDIRGFPRYARGGFLPTHAEPTRVTFGYVGLDNITVQTVVEFDRPAAMAVTEPTAGAVYEPAVLLPGLDRLAPRLAPPIPPGVVATFSLVLPPDDPWELNATVMPVPASGVAISREATFPGGQRPTPARILTDNTFFNRLLDRSAADLAMLQTSFPQGALPAAGIPWYVAPFGRDSLIVGLQTFHTSPHGAAGTLRFLADLQGTRVDPWRDEQPGKILHEMRYGEMARLHEIPHSPYYGTVDATPLFVLLFAETVAWTADDALYRDLLPNVRRALAWIEEYGDLDDDGFVEYRTGTVDGVRITNQGWKDSYDSLNHVDGRPALGDVALVEVQGYVYAAYRRLAEVVAARGDETWAEALTDRAESLRRKVEDAFWLEGEGFYAQALDGEKRPVAAISSNPGHLLYCELPSPERASAVIRRLCRPDLDSGWGIRTLSTDAVSYNPMSYHNGSVWPHDNSLIAAGMARYGHHDEANAIAGAIFAAALTNHLTRLPELYCGFARTASPVDAPVAYPVSCSPQAWAAGSAALLVRSMLGLRADPRRGEVEVRPALPEWLNEITVEGLSVLRQPASVTVRHDRDRGGYCISTTDPIRQG